MHTFGRLMIVIVCLLFNINSNAAESEEEKDSPWLLTPPISSDPKLGTTLGFLGAYLKKFDEESPASNHDARDNQNSAASGSSFEFNNIAKTAYFSITWMV